MIGQILLLMHEQSAVHLDAGGLGLGGFERNKEAKALEIMHKTSNLVPVANRMVMASGLGRFVREAKKQFFEPAERNIRNGRR